MADEWKRCLCCWNIPGGNDIGFNPGREVFEPDIWGC